MSGEEQHPREVASGQGQEAEGVEQQLAEILELLGTVSERQEDLRQEVDALRADARYLILSQVDALEEEAYRHRVTLQARAHFEGRPDLLGEGERRSYGTTHTQNERGSE